MKWLLRRKKNVFASYRIFHYNFHTLFLSFHGLFRTSSLSLYSYTYFSTLYFYSIEIIKCCWYTHIISTIFGFGCYYEIIIIIIIFPQKFYGRRWVVKRNWRIFEFLQRPNEIVIKWMIREIYKWKLIINWLVNRKWMWPERTVTVIHNIWVHCRYTLEPRLRIPPFDLITNEPEKIEIDTLTGLQAILDMPMAGTI